ncbi:YihY/virulence factor BrkB family protein [Pseudorhodoplanes sp.]|uniref:YihY/virulence factor BrkB family protein n=1 Tax=Pseudorhodoplanes sp. TaxID=1934341 RepID=UPI003D0E3121
MWRAIACARRDHVTLISAGVAFFMLLAMFPGLAATLSVYSVFSNPGQGTPILSVLPAILPDQVIQFISIQIKQIAQRQQATQAPFDWATILGFGMLLWSANKGMPSLIVALHTIDDTEESYGFVTRTALSLAFTIGILLFFVGASALILVLPLALDALDLDATSVIFLRLLRWPVLLVVIGLLLAVIYRFGSTQTSPRWRWVSAGSIAAAFLWLSFSILFEWMVTTFGSFDRLYGSLSAVVGFMIWVWISIIAVLFGAELNAVVFRRLSESDSDVSGNRTTASDRRTR